MKKYIGILLFVCILTLFSSCTYSEMSSKLTDSDELNISTDNKNLNTSENIGQQTDWIEEKLVIYQLDRDAFLEFIEHPSAVTLEEKKWKKQTISDATEYLRVDAQLFPITLEFVTLFEDTRNVEALLSERGVTEKIEQVFLVDAATAPIFAWVKGEDFNGFLKCDLLSPYDSNYEFSFLTHEDFLYNYRKHTAIITINGQQLADDAKAFLYHNSADIPLLAVLKFLGATVSELKNSSVQVQYKNTKYTINLKEASIIKQEEDWNQLIAISGPMYRYEQNGDLMLDSNSFRVALERMGTLVTVDCNRENDIVNIIES